MRREHRRQLVERLGWLGVKPITDPERIRKLLVNYHSGKIVAAVGSTPAAKTPVGVGLPQPAQWTGLELLRLMHIVFGHAPLTTLLPTIQIWMQYARELYLNLIININWIPTKEQIADLFTKPLDKTTFLCLRSLLMSNSSGTNTL